jgi:hypothetical protein
MSGARASFARTLRAAQPGGPWAISQISAPSIWGTTQIPSRGTLPPADARPHIHQNQ